MSKVRSPELKGEGFPAGLQPGPVHWALIGAIISGPVAEAAAGWFVSAPKASVLAPSSSVFQLRSGSQRVAFRYPHSWSIRGPFFKHCSINSI